MGGSVQHEKQREGLTAISVAGKYASAIKLALLIARESSCALCVTHSIAFDLSDAADAKLVRENILECTKEVCRWERISKSCIGGSTWSVRKSIHD